MFGKLNKQAIYSGLVLVFLALGAFFMVNVELPWWSHYLSAVSIVLFALPSFWAVRWWLGWRHGGALIITLGAFAILLETSAILTGFPYGHFGYSDVLGFRIFGLTPWTVAFAWTPLMLGAYSVAANLIENRTGRVIAAAAIVTLFDIVLDPGAVLLGFWKYAEGGWFYGVPISNFAGWLFSGLIGAVLIEIQLKRIKPILPTPVQLASSTIFIIFFWSAIAKHGGLTISAVTGLAIVAALVVFYRRYHYAFDDKVVFVDEANKAIATGDKLPSHTDNTKLHRAFSVFLFDREGKFLMQQRALSKKTWPGVWSNSCCGHVMLHESTEAAVRRRLRYELGLTGIDLTLVLPDFRYRAEKDGIVENEICPVFMGVTNKSPRPNPTEVESVKWVDWEEFVEWAEDPETDISPWAVEEARELIRSEVFHKIYPQKSGAAAGVR